MLTLGEVMSCMHALSLIPPEFIHVDLWRRGGQVISINGGTANEKIAGMTPAKGRLVGRRSSSKNLKFVHHQKSVLTDDGAIVKLEVLE